jgi:hypothetical protein
MLLGLAHFGRAHVGAYMTEPYFFVARVDDNFFENKNWTMCRLICPDSDHCGDREIEA